MRNRSFFWRFIFPVLYGLLMYASIRLVNDTTAGERFWEKDWWINATEITIVILTSFLFDAVFQRYLGRLDRSSTRFSVRSILREFGEILLICLISINVVLFIIHYLIRDPVEWNDIVIADIVVGLYLLLYYAITRGNILLREYVNQRLQLEQAHSKNLETELKFLKAQFHPHFLMNALNTVYFQMDEDVAGAKKTIERFSELLRYQLYDQQKKVPLEQELRYLRNYVALQQTRGSGGLTVNMNLDVRDQSVLLYPLLLQPLVENAFKYVGGEQVINIGLRQESEELIYEVENSLPEGNEMPGRKGVGLQHLQRRLELLYPGIHRFRSEAEGRIWKAVLVLPLET